MPIGRRGQHLLQSRYGAAVPEAQKLFDASQLFHIAGLVGNRRRFKSAAPQPVRGEQFGNALGVPNRGGQAAQRERAGMHPFVQQKMAPVGGVGVVDQPEAVAIAEAIAKGRNRAVGRQQAGGLERLPIDHQAPHCPPGVHRRPRHLKMVAPHGESRVENLGKVLDPVVGAHRPVGDQDQMPALEHPQAGPAGSRHHRLRGHFLSSHPPRAEQQHQQRPNRAAKTPARPPTAEASAGF